MAYDHLPNEKHTAPRGFSAIGVQSRRPYVILSYKTADAEIRTELSPQEAAALATALERARSFADPDMALVDAVNARRSALA